MSDARKRLEDARERWRHNTDAARRNIRRTAAQIRADHEAEMAERSAANWARWEGQERFGDDA